MRVAGGAVFAGSTEMLVIGLNQGATAKRGEVALAVAPGSATASARF
ncbi:MAG: hypothetical protein WKG00_40400 [Polyangiaceae bacterium]